MSGARLVGVILVVGGVLALIYGGFTYTKSSSEADLGPVSIEVSDEETVNIPLWAGVGAVVIGAVALTMGGKR